MSRMSSDPDRQALNGPTMGTRWSALFYTTGAFAPAPVRSALQAAVDEVDEQMSGWKPDSDLMRLNAGVPQGLFAKPRLVGPIVNIAHAACWRRAPGSLRER